MIEWNIQSRAHVCQACEKKFIDKQSYHTLLSAEKQEFHRVDVCEPCWQEQFSDGARDRKGFVSYWQGVYEAPPPPEAEAMQKETVETLLRKIIELNDPQYRDASYILAVMLERKRLLKIKEQMVTEGRRVFVYEHPKSGDVFTIPDPDLHLDQLEKVQHDVALLLEHGLNPPVDAPETIPPSEGESGENESAASTADASIAESQLAPITEPATFGPERTPDEKFSVEAEPRESEPSESPADDSPEEAPQHPVSTQ